MKTLLLTLLSLFSLNALAQSTKVNEVTQKDFVKFTESIQGYELFKGEQLWAKVFLIDNGSGSAGTESCEVSYSLLICLAQYDEYPDSKLYKIGPFVSPKVSSKVDAGKSIMFHVRDEHGTGSKMYKLAVSETSAEIQTEEQK